MKTPIRMAAEPDTAVPDIRTDFSRDAAIEICGTLRLVLADVFSLYLKTTSFHWHMTGSHFRDYHLLLDEHANQIFAMTDDVAERARKMGGSTLRSISDISRHKQLKDKNDEGVSSKQMMAELRADNVQLPRFPFAAHRVCEGTARSPPRA
jgi:starvation-inducible DNA-binding protein